MDATVRMAVRRRAGDQCEYCHIRQQDSPVASFQVEHIIARQHGGGDDLDNLALACNRCNLHKGPNLAGVDPVSGKIVALYHPRRQRWSAHFAEEDAIITGLTRTGRATVDVLKMNGPERVELRAMRRGS